MSRRGAAILLVLGISIMLAARTRLPPAENAGAPEPSSIPGYDELGACSSSHAVESDNILVMHQDGLAELIKGDATTTTGFWRFDPPTERYTVSFGGEPTTYERIVLGRWVCLLLKGDRATADIAGSWYAMESADDGD